MIVEIDPISGATSGIWNPEDETAMNWVLKRSNWGLVEGFDTKEVILDEACAEDIKTVCIKAVNEAAHLEMTIEKRMTEQGYYETYKIYNPWRTDFFLTKENFGIPFPYQCLFGHGNHYLDGTCITHVWCGGDVCWMYSGKVRGKAPYLVTHMVQGAADDYSISYDISRTDNGSHFRGVIVLHPRECVIPKGEAVEYTFFHRFCEEKPEDAPLAYEGAMRFTADHYSLLAGEQVKLTLEGTFEECVKMSCGEESIPFSVEDGKLTAYYTLNQTGEYQFTVQAGDKKTWLNVKVLPPLEEILEKRARFIVEKQQYVREGSSLHGAYLIYDAETERMYSKSGGTDHNALHERMAFGVAVCKQLQRKYDEKMMESLRLHKEFLEREFLDTETGKVYNEEGKNGVRDRIYNYSWVSVFYLEWYHLTGDLDALKVAAQILLKFYEVTNANNEAQCIEMVPICKALEKEGMFDLLEQIKTWFIAHGDSILERNGVSVSEETAWCNENSDCLCAYLSQIYLLTGEKKYLDGARMYVDFVRMSYGKQPNFHQNCISVRYWDRYWFGKYASYGDLYPHYWSVLNAWALYWFAKAVGEEELYKDEIVSCITGNLCVYREDGFAYNNYLFPYKIVQYTSDPSYQNPYLKPGVFYGGNYDPWSNDQDWTLYYAAQILLKKED